MTPPGGRRPGSGAATEDERARQGIDPRIKQRRVAVRRREGRRRLHVLVTLAVAVVVIVGGLVLVHSSVFGVKVVTVGGSHPHTTSAAIVAAAGLGGQPPLIDVSTGGVAAKVEALPYVAKATVSLGWPDAVHITVTEREAALTMAGPGTSWSVLDGTGRTLAVGAARPAGLPVLIVHDARGPVPPAAVGHALPAIAHSGLAVSRSLPRAFSAQVVSVTEAADSTVSLALDSGLTVLLGTASNLSQKYEDIASIIANASLRGAKTIDVTVPQSPTVGTA